MLNAQQVNIIISNLKGKLLFKNTMQIFRHFPSLTVSVDDVLLKGSKPFEQDTLLTAKELSFGINLKNLIFNGEIKIDEILCKWRCRQCFCQFQRSGEL